MTAVSPAYDTRRREHQARASALGEALLERLSWTRPQLESHQRAALAGILRVALHRSPWHAKRLAHVDPDAVIDPGVDLEPFLSALPTMTKDDLMEHFDEIVTDERLSIDVVEAHLATLEAGPAYLLDEYHVVMSGGSTGRRGVFVYGWDGWATWYLGVIRQRLRHRAAGETGPMVIASMAAGHPAHMSNAIGHTFTDTSLRVLSLPVTMPTDEVVAQLNEAQPNALGGYPSALHPLAFAAVDGRLRIQPRYVTSFAEPLLPEIREVLEEAFGQPVENVWGCSEGAFAVSCGEGEGMHLCEDLALVEPVDEAGDGVRPGVRSARILVTNLFNPALPLIRYEVTDEVVILPDRCPCGSAHRRIGEVLGRHDDRFVYGDVAVHPHVFRTLLGRHRHVVEYRVTQTPSGADVDVHAAGDVDVECLREDLVAALARLGVVDPVVSVRCVPPLERTATGKLRRFVPLPAAERLSPRP